jgi:hypothetical protein
MSSAGTALVFCIESFCARCLPRDHVIPLGSSAAVRPKHEILKQAIHEALRELQCEHERRPDDVSALRCAGLSANRGEHDNRRRECAASPGFQAFVTECNEKAGGSQTAKALDSTVGDRDLADGGNSLGSRIPASLTQALT